jgi:hypothetical protein
MNTVIIMALAIIATVAIPNTYAVHLDEQVLAYNPPPVVEVEETIEIVPVVTHWSEQLYEFYDYRMIEKAELDKALMYLHDQDIIELNIPDTSPADFIVRILESR